MMASIFSNDMPSTVSAVMPFVVAPRVAVNLAVSGQIELLVEELSIHPSQRQSSFASFTEKSQVRVGGLHCACLSVYGLLDTFPVHRDR